MGFSVSVENILITLSQLSILQTTTKYGYGKKSPKEELP
jgi:hypothetical protein